MRRRTFLAFMLGFFQVTVGMTVEVLVIYYLSTLQSLMTIIIKFASLAKIVTFDDMYAKSLYEHNIKGAKNKQLKIYFHRRDCYAEGKEEVKVEETKAEEKPQKESKAKAA